MEYLVFAAGAVIFGLFLLWCIVDAALDARTRERTAPTAPESPGHDQISAATPSH
ncbi:MAG TPA: hypothetical protein VN133_05550 [Humibacter sp.]|nr:hypothetical protein [Humibacter sp.]